MMLGLVLITMIGSIDVAPALAKDDHKRPGKHDNGHYENRGPGNNLGRPASASFSRPSLFILKKAEREAYLALATPARGITYLRRSNT